MVLTLTVVTPLVWHSLSLWLLAIFGTRRESGYSLMMALSTGMVTPDFWYSSSPWLLFDDGTPRVRGYWGDLVLLPPLVPQWNGTHRHYGSLL